MMKVVYSEDCLLHDPEYETLSGRRVPYLESPSRYKLIREALSFPSDKDVKLFEFVEEVETFKDVQPYIVSVHSPEYVNYLENAYEEWVKDGGDRGAVVPDTFMHHQLKGDVDVSALRPIAKAGMYCEYYFIGRTSFDLSTPITADTYHSAIAAVRVTLTASQILVRESRDNNERQRQPLGVFALSRPPGHHAGTAICGGYCFFNNVAIAARFLQTAEEKSEPVSDTAPIRVAILDIDYHHGNGTQEIFYRDSSVFYVSIHASQDYPYFTGASGEQGEGEGHGFNLNIPLPRVSTGDEEYYSALLGALGKITEFDPRYVIVSLGVDTYKDDPICEFNLTQSGYLRIGQAIATLQRPTLFVMEGGYHLPTIGTNVRAVLQSFMMN